MENFEENLTVLLECEDETNLEAGTVEKVISLLWKAPVLQFAALKILTTACLQEFQKQTQNTGYTITTLVINNITQLLDHQILSWAGVIFEWSVGLLTAISSKKFKSELSLEVSLKTWLGVNVIQVISNIVTRCLTNLLPDSARLCVQSLIALTKVEGVHVRWIIFYVICKNPSLMVPHLIEVAVDFHCYGDNNNSLAINLAHCLSHLSRFHRDTVKNCLTKFIMALFDLTDQLELRRHIDFLFWLVKSDSNMFCLAANETLHQITAANIRALLGIYYGVKKPDPPSKIVIKMEQASASEDEGEVISSDEDSDKGSLKPEPPKITIVKEEKEEAKNINKNDTDYTPAVVELICHLGDNVAMVAIRLLIDCAQLMGIPAKDNQTEEAMEEGEVNEVSLTGKGRLNEAARTINLLLIRIQEVAFTKLYPAAKGTGTVAEEVIHFTAALQSSGRELCDMLLQAGEGMIQYWLYQLVIFVGQISSEMHAAQLIGYLLLKCDTNDKLSVVVNMFHEVSVVHSKLASASLQCVITQLLPVTPGDLNTVVANVLAIVQLPKTSAKQLQVRGYYLEAVKEHIQVLSELLVNNVTGDSDTIMATGKLLSLMATGINEKPRKHCRSLNERIKVARNLLNCFFELIKSEVTGDCDMRCDMWLVSCADVITSLLSQQQDGLENFVFSTVLKTVLSHDMRNYFGAIIRIPKANTIQGSSNNLPSTVTVHNLNHMLCLFYSCCHADKSHYLSIARVMMDQLAPSVVPDHVAWPTREHFKYYMETNLSIKRLFDENPILWSLLQLLAEDPAAILWCSGLLCALLCIIINHWCNMKGTTVQLTPTELKSSCHLAEILAEAKWLHPSMMYISEVFHLLSPPEMFQLMNAIYNHVKLHLVVAQDTASLEENLQQYTTTLKTVLRNHVLNLGALFARYYPKTSEPQSSP